MSPQRPVVCRSLSGSSLFGAGRSFFAQCPCQSAKRRQEGIKKSHFRGSGISAFVGFLDLSRGLAPRRAAGLVVEGGGGAFGKFYFQGLEGVGQGVVIAADYKHVHNASVPNLGAEGVEGGVGDTVLAQQLQDELDHVGVLGRKSHRGAEFVNRGNDFIADPGFLGRPLVDGPHVVTVGLAGRC